jgi:hypothetical protein
MYDEANIQQLVRRAWHEARSIDMGHLGEHDRVLVCKAVVDLIEAISRRWKTRTSRRQYVVIVRDHHQLRVELRELLDRGRLNQQKRSPDPVELMALSAQVGGVGLVCRQRREQRLRLGDLRHFWGRRETFERRREDGMGVGGPSSRQVELR